MNELGCCLVSDMKASTSPQHSATIKSSRIQLPSASATIYPLKYAFNVGWEQFVHHCIKPKLSHSCYLLLSLWYFQDISITINCWPLLSSKRKSHGIHRHGASCSTHLYVYKTHGKRINSSI